MKLDKMKMKELGKSSKYFVICGRNREVNIFKREREMKRERERDEERETLRWRERRAR